MLKSISVVAAVAVALCFATTAYAAQKGPQSEEDDTPSRLPPLQKNFPLDQTWSLKELNGKPVPPGLDISLKIDGTLRGSGFTGCNSWSATLYPVKDQHLAVGPYALTKKQCPKDVMQVETGVPVRAGRQPDVGLGQRRSCDQGAARRVAARPLALGCSSVRLAGSGSALTVAGAPFWGSEHDSPLVKLIDRRLMANRDDRRARQRFDNRAIKIGLALLVE